MMTMTLAFPPSGAWVGPPADSEAVEVRCPPRHGRAAGDPLQAGKPEGVEPGRRGVRMPSVPSRFGAPSASAPRFSVSGCPPTVRRHHPPLLLSPHPPRICVRVSRSRSPAPGRGWQVKAYGMVRRRSAVEQRSPFRAVLPGGLPSPRFTH